MKETYIKKGNVVIRFTRCNLTKMATIITNYGCTFTEDEKYFDTSEEGNAFYIQCRKDGFVNATMNDYSRIVNGY